MPNQMPDLNLYNQQWEFIQAPEKLVLFLSGVGGGKSTAGAVWSIFNCKNYPHAVGFIGANTFDQLHKSTLPKLFSLLRELKIN